MPYRTKIKSLFSLSPTMLHCYGGNMSLKNEPLFKELASCNAKLEQYAKELEAFTSIVCHELQEPLRKIKSYGLLIQEKKHLLTAELNGYFAQIIAVTELMGHMIQSLQDLAFVGKKELNFERVDLNQIVDNVWQELQLTIHESKATIKVQEELPNVKADGWQMFQLFSHLISNAINFCKKHPVILIRREKLSKDLRAS